MFHSNTSSNPHFSRLTFFDCSLSGTHSLVFRRFSLSLSLIDRDSGPAKPFTKTYRNIFVVKGTLRDLPGYKEKYFSWIDFIKSVEINNINEVNLFFVLN